MSARVEYLWYALAVAALFMLGILSELYCLRHPGQERIFPRYHRQSDWLIQPQALV